ncbi:MAG: histidinol phosphate phosphatase domain-containing protein [Candidatus Omnitrophota bacterium]
MIDLHTHTLFSDGELLPSELVRRAEAKGYTAIALSDHVDASNIDFVIPRIVNVCKVLNRYWKIRSIPGAEITHAPIQEIKPLVRLARKLGAKIVVVHGETLSEPVMPGTNRRAIEARCDILAHPGLINREDAVLAARNNVYLELTTRKNHLKTNKRVFKMANLGGAKLVLNNDAHSGDDLVSHSQARRILQDIGLKDAEIKALVRNSAYLAANC